VAYHVELSETTVTPYLDCLELSPEGRRTLDRVIDQLATYGDRFAREAHRRLSPGSATFEVRWVFRDPGTQIFHNLRLIVSDAAAQYGVLRVVFAEDETAIGATPFS
jgi:hypothetical protein